jgi:hypothetical protein
MYALKFMWGGDTIEISGKIKKNSLLFTVKIINLIARNINHIHNQ